MPAPTFEIDDTSARVSLEKAQVESIIRVRQKMVALRLQLEALIKRKLSGDVLNVRTGQLRRSIASDEQVSGSTIVERVYSSGNVPYAAIHEYGGKTKAHDILPKKAQALHFVVGGKDVFAKIVHHPGSNIPERSYMRSSLNEMRADIIASLIAAAGPK